MRTMNAYMGVVFGLATSGCLNTDGGTYSTLTLAVGGAGQIVSRDGALDCSSDGTTSSGTCQMRTFVDWNGDGAMPMSYQLCAVPAAGSTFGAWSFTVSADCPGCASADPEMGAIEVHGGEADVRVDVNAGYDVDGIVLANFAPSTTPGTTPMSTTSPCW